MSRPPSGDQAPHTSRPPSGDRHMLDVARAPGPRPPGPDMMRAPPPERLMAHELPPHYPYMRPQLRGPPPYAPFHEMHRGAPAAPPQPPSPEGRESPPESKPSSQAAREEAAREEGSVFGGLVSYFSSQREDDLDA